MHRFFTSQSPAFMIFRNVATIAQLQPETVVVAYRLTGSSSYFQQANNPKYVQDATAAIVIDDPNWIITTTYNLYDGITGIAGTLSVYAGLLQFVPLADPGAATSHNNTIVPVTRTLATITSADQAKLLKIYGVTLTTTTTGLFLATAENITATDASGTIIMKIPVPIMPEPQFQQTLWILSVWEANIMIQCNLAPVFWQI